MSSQESSVQVQLLNAHGEPEGFFSPKQWQSFAEAADDAWLTISRSCCAGACFTCCCRIKKWQEDVDIGLLSVPLVDIDEDQTLSCISGPKDSIFTDGKFHTIILQKLI